MAVYTIVTEEDQRRESRTTCLFRGTSSVPVGEISLGSRSNNHKVVSGLRSIKPSASAFSGGLYVRMSSFLSPFSCDLYYTADQSIVQMEPRSIHGKILLMVHGL